ncbi:MAG: response regulator [Magnetococcales bacterium]|nr:response regulator [Magnetococcales bacterium]
MLARVLACARSLLATGLDAGQREKVREIIALVEPVVGDAGSLSESVAGSSPGEGNPGGGVSPVGGKGLRILVVEDNVFTQQLMSRLLEMEGHSVVLVANGIEALAALDGAVFDVVLMDLGMPRMDGLEATAAIRARERERSRSPVPIIAVTASVSADHVGRAKASGMDGFHGKPIRAKALFAEIERVLEKARGMVPAVMVGGAGSHSVAEVVGGSSALSGGAVSGVEGSPVAGTGGGGEGRAFFLDMAHVMRSMAGDWGLLEEVIDLFFREAPGQMQRIREGILGADNLAVQEVAHSLKGASGAFGNTHEVYRLAFQLESLGRRGDLGEALGVWEELRAALGGLREALRQGQREREQVVG